MNLESRVEKLEKHSGHKRGRIVVYYEGQPYPECEPEDTVFKVVYGQPEARRERSRSRRERARNALERLLPVG